MYENMLGQLHELKVKRNAVILAHYYQPDEIQELADYVGDSFKLSKIASETKAEVIVFCGVHFMAETAAILAPQKTVLLPEKKAGCPLADTITAEELKKQKRRYGNVAVVCYINSSAEVKAESDICCTSSNAVKVVSSLKEQNILFVPDKNLGDYVAKKVSKNIVSWNGKCPSHDAVNVEDVENFRKANPDALVAVHPECKPEVTSRADYVGSTSGIIKYVLQEKAPKYGIGTEKGILYQLRKANPHKRYFLLSSGLVCPDMKLTGLEKVIKALKDMEPRITVPERIRVKAEIAVRRMLAVN